MKKITINKSYLRKTIFIGYMVIILGFFGGLYYFFDLLSHFYLQYFIVGIFIFILTLFSKDKTSIFSSLVLLLFLGFNISKVNFLNAAYKGKADYYYLNSNYYINDPIKIVDDIRKYNPEYVVIVELNKILRDAIQEEFSFSNIIYHSDGVKSFGLFTNSEIIDYKIHDLTYPVGEVKTKNETLFIVHPLPPLNRSLATSQKQNFKEIIKLYNDSNSNRKIIIGDFNSSYYSQVFKKYFGDMYFDVIYSWKVNSILRLPIDYVIGNKDFFQTHRSRLEVSDHSPLLINLKSNGE